jgi:hypothetical protein
MNEDDRALRVPADAPLLTAAAWDDAPVRGGTPWLRESARMLAFRAPRWEGLEAAPATVAAPIVAGYLLHFVAQRVMLPGTPMLLWQGFLAGWAGIAILAWLCWVVARSRSVQAPATPGPATLFALVCIAGLMLGLVSGGIFVGMRAALDPFEHWPLGLQLTAWLVPLFWAGLTQLVLLWRAAGSGLARGAALLLVPIPLMLNGWLAPPTFWWAGPSGNANAEAEAEPETGLPLTDETLGRQAQLITAALQGLLPPQRGRVNVYAATYAPNASEDVFRRESAAVARTMRERFGANGRLVELVANRATSDTLPWGTPANLRLTISRMAAVMDRDRDVLFLHLTSHGARDGKLANDTWPLKTQSVTPELLKQWLDEAGVRWRVISVSACYSGSWIAPLAGDGTLVMTAADAEHTSYGCGRRSELTFFGRAMYEDALRKTWSFTEAHAAARKLIEVREQEAGKSDGYSNPQISEGAGIHAVLERLADERRQR